MPELPEVETVRRSLHARLVGRVLVSCEVRFPGVLQIDPLVKQPLFPAAFQGTGRRGKMLWLELSERQSLLAHFRMTGAFYFRREGQEPVAHTHVEFPLEDGDILSFRDSRRFGGLWWLESGSLFSNPPLAGVGPDAMEITQGEFMSLFQSKSRMTKPLLLDQHTLAGLGNIYVDEILFRAEIHPKQPSDSISELKLITLWKLMRETLNEAIELGGSSIRDFIDSNGVSGRYQEKHLVYRKQETPCTNCGGPLRRILVAQRGTCYCPKCQKIYRRKKRIRSR